MGVDDPASSRSPPMRRHSRDGGTRHGATAAGRRSCDGLERTEARPKPDPPLTTAGSPVPTLASMALHPISSGPQARSMRRFKAPSVVLGTAAALAAAVITAGWQLATRHGATTTLGPLDLALLRYFGPALVLLPLWRGLLPRARSSCWKVVGLTVLTGGLPFGLLISAGAQWAPASHVAVFTNGTVPIFAALLAWLSTREHIGARRAVGFLLVPGGAAIPCWPWRVAGQLSGYRVAAANYRKRHPCARDGGCRPGRHRGWPCPQVRQLWRGCSRAGRGRG